MTRHEAQIDTSGGGGRRASFLVAQLLSVVATKRNRRLYNLLNADHYSGISRWRGRTEPEPSHDENTARSFSSPCEDERPML